MNDDQQTQLLYNEPVLILNGIPLHTRGKMCYLAHALFLRSCHTPLTALYFPISHIDNNRGWVFVEVPYQPLFKNNTWTAYQGWMQKSQLSPVTAMPSFSLVRFPPSFSCSLSCFFSFLLFSFSYLVVCCRPFTILIFLCIFFSLQTVITTSAAVYKRSCTPYGCLPEGVFLFLFSPLLFHPLLNCYFLCHTIHSHITLTHFHTQTFSPM